jgi:hypothetical protein
MRRSQRRWRPFLPQLRNGRPAGAIERGQIVGGFRQQPAFARDSLPLLVQLFFAANLHAARLRNLPVAASGHWGVPTFVFENEPFFGQDRIELLIWRMESKGLRRA